ncbi:MAG: HD domain-containing protein [Peptostreptococcaceae bacterium]
MSRFENIINDEIIIETYSKIAEFEDLDKGWAYHNIEHVMNVANLMEALLSKLNYNKNFIEEAKIAAILHDVGAIEGKEGHALRSYEFSKKYLIDRGIVLENKDLVLDAIKVHSDGFYSDNIIALTLILSDKLDIKYTRVAKEGYNAKGMKELQYIEDILIDIYNQELIIRFICDERINKKDLEEFYFTMKVFNAISSFARKMNLNPKVFWNNEEWEWFKIKACFVD